MCAVTTSFNPNTKITTCRWTFKQGDVNKLKNAANGNYIQSNDFETKEDCMNAKWYLRCYPKGYNKTYNGHCQMFLHLSSIPNTYKSIKIYYYMKYMKHNASFETGNTFVKSGDKSRWQKSPLLSELQLSNPIAFEVEIRIINMINKNNSPIYGLSLPLYSINQKHQIKWHVSNELLNSFKHWKCMTQIYGRSFPVKSNMFTIYCCPNGTLEKYKGNVSLYLKMLLYPNGVQSMKIKFTIKCPQLNKLNTDTQTFSEKNNSWGKGKYCLTKTFVESGPLDIIYDIQIIEIDTRPALEMIHSVMKDVNINDEKKDETNNKDNKISALQKQLDETTQLKERRILSLQKENETLRNNRDETQINTTLQTQITQLKTQLDETKQAKETLQKENEMLRSNKDKMQTQINQLKNNVMNIRNELDETTQANLRQRQTILELQNLNQEEEEKMYNKQKYLSKILIDLESEIKIFKQNYNKKRLNEIFDKNAMELIQNNSEINTNINKYNNNNANIVISCQSFGQYINDLKSFIKTISIPDINKYKTWNLEQMMLWIISLDNGKYIEYKQQLRNGFQKSKILSGDLLPELTRGDLSNSPFNINEFIIKRDLEKHFKSLLQSNIIPYEGGQTQYIDK